MRLQVQGHHDQETADPPPSRARWNCQTNASDVLPTPLRTEAPKSNVDIVSVEIAERMEKITRLKGNSRATCSCPSRVVDGQPGATSKIRAVDVAGPTPPVKPKVLPGREVGTGSNDKIGQPGARKKIRAVANAGTTSPVMVAPRTGRRHGKQDIDKVKWPGRHWARASDSADTPHVTGQRETPQRQSLR